MMLIAHPPTPRKPDEIDPSTLERKNLVYLPPAAEIRKLLPPQPRRPAPAPTPVPTPPPANQKSRISIGPPSDVRQKELILRREDDLTKVPEGEKPAPPVPTPAPTPVPAHALSHAPPGPGAPGPEHRSGEGRGEARARGPEAAARPHRAGPVRPGRPQAHGRANGPLDRARDGRHEPARHPRLAERDPHR